MRYDILIVGAGLYGAVVADRLTKKGKKCLIIDKRNHIGGNLYTENIEGINVHKYGPHVFHTSNKMVWDYINSFAEFNNFINSPLANYKGEIYNLPFNMNTFNKIWGVTLPIEAKKIIEKQKEELNIKTPLNLAEQAKLLVGYDIYELLIKGYTEKQWGRKAENLPADIIKRLPLRFTYNNNYFDDRYQGVPIGGYNNIVEIMIQDCDVQLNINYMNDKKYFYKLTDRIIFTGMIDEYFEYEFGKLEYRSLRFEEETLETENFQGNAIVNYTDIETDYTRIIEHKHFEFGNQHRTVITKEFPKEWNIGDEPYYPINDDKNNQKYSLYRDLADKDTKLVFGGRLGEFKYYDMDEIIEKALLIKV